MAITRTFAADCRAISMMKSGILVLLLYTLLLCLDESGKSFGVSAYVQNLPDARAKSRLSSASSAWDSFDYNKHWYPVSWISDLPRDKPHRISLFDTEYAVVVTKDNSGAWTAVALEDRCPHKSAAFSEGRFTTTGFIQCAYHGWSFNGTTGACVQIPQASQSSSFSTRSCATAVPTQIHQGLLWLWPGPVLEPLPSPPTVAEMDDPAFKYAENVRDFHFVDWTLLLSNIMDPDHGMFAHQNVAFDMYSASPQMPVSTQQEFDGAGWTLTSRVLAQNKLRNTDRLLRGQETKELPQNITAVTTFHAPTHVTICRRDDTTQETKFISAFWVCPVGTGRSRLMSTAAGKLPFAFPRWMSHIALNNFLDQDTQLVATQQAPVLSAEAEAVLENRQTARPGRARVGARGGLFVYQSPTDRSVRLIDQFWDATLSKVPRRAKTLLSLYKAGFLKDTPPRNMVLDRKTQHLDICPDSQATVRNLVWIKRGSMLTAAGWALASVLQKISPRRSCWAPILAACVGLVAEKLRSQFYFVYHEGLRDRDLKNIPIRTWSDPS